jgi:2-alkyl-3-oxoalkanoate reductase
MRIAVSGATGVIGRRVVPLLLSGGHDVTAITRPDVRRRDTLPAEVKTVNASLFDTAQLTPAIKGHDAVINLATHIPTGMFEMLRLSSWAENDHIRREGSKALVDAAYAAGVETFIQESVALAYPSRDAEWLDESVPLDPPANGLSVLAAEAAVQSFVDRGGRGIALRFAGFYGPDASQTLLMAKSIKSGWAPLPGKRSFYISSVSHDDAASAAVAALGVEAGVYNVSDDAPVTRETFFDIIARTLGVKPPHYLPTWTAHLMGIVGATLVRSTRVSNKKFRAASSWQPAFPSVADGLPQAVRDAVEGS